MKNSLTFFLAVTFVQVTHAVLGQEERHAVVVVAEDTRSGKMIALRIGQKVKIKTMTLTGYVKAKVAGATDSTIAFYEGDYLAVVNKTDLSKIRVRGKVEHRAFGVGLITAGTLALVMVNGMSGNGGMSAMGNLLSIGAIAGGVALVKERVIDLRKSWVLRPPQVAMFQSHQTKTYLP